MLNPTPKIPRKFTCSQRFQLRILFLVIFTSVHCAAAEPAQPSFEQGESAYKNGDYAAALREWRPLAVKGDARAQSEIGWMFLRGRGVSENFTEAKTWLEKAAEQANDNALYGLGLMYEGGLGVEQDYKKTVALYTQAAEHGHSAAQFRLGLLLHYQQDYKRAFEWYEKSAVQGNEFAQTSLAQLYSEGLGVPQDYAKAIIWLGKAVDQGFARAQAKLGVFYENGHGVPQDYARAFDLYQKSAEQGDGQGQIFLSHLYIQGRGVPQNWVHAYMWLTLATKVELEADSHASIVVEHATKMIALAEEAMTKAQIDEARRLAADWMANRKSKSEKPKTE